MPELPEVETMVRGIRPYCEGRELQAFRLCACDCKPISLRPGEQDIRRKAEGRRVVAVRRRAKRVVFELEHGWCFVIEPRMTGLMLLSDPPDHEHLRVEWRMSGRQRYDSVWFWDRRGLGTVQLLSPAEVQQKLGEPTLGPDALDMPLELWRDRCRETSRAIKVVLLDQRFVAGIGNLYASEILHLARIHPETAADGLNPQQIARLHAATREVLETAILHEGSTLSDATYRNALNQSGSYQNQHRVYQKAEETCGTCGEGVVQRIVQAQRSTFFCQTCQPRRTRRARRR